MKWERPHAVLAMYDRVGRRCSAMDTDASPRHDEHPGQNSMSTGWRETRRAQGYKQLNYYHSYVPYLPTYWFGSALNRW